MKNLFLSITTGLILLTGCSTDPINSDLEDQFLEETQTIDNETEEREPVFDISFTESGSVTMLPNNDCAELESFQLQGATNQTVFGIFRTSAQMCTDFQFEYKLKGFHYLENGDQINYTITNWEVEGPIIRFIYEYDGGTGAFEGATGELQVSHRMIEVDDSRQMSYLNIASGQIRLAIN